MDNNNIDVTMVYSTDGLNKKSDLVILEDDLSFYPRVLWLILIRDTLFEEYKKLLLNWKILISLEGLIDNETMIEMNYAVDAEGRNPRDVAKEFLIKNGLSE